MALYLPINRPLSVKTGDQFSFTFSISDKDGYTVTARDLTGYTGVGQVRQYSDVSSTLIMDMTFSSDAADLLAGRIVMTIPSATTTLATPGVYFYDIYVTDGVDYVKTYYEGKFTVKYRVAA